MRQFQLLAGFLVHAHIIIDPPAHQIHHRQRHLILQLRGNRIRLQQIFNDRCIDRQGNLKLTDIDQQPRQQLLIAFGVGRILGKRLTNHLRSKTQCIFTFHKGANAQIILRQRFVASFDMLQNTLCHCIMPGAADVGKLIMNRCQCFAHARTADVLLLLGELVNKIFTVATAHSLKSLLFGSQLFQKVTMQCAMQREKAVGLCLFCGTAALCDRRALQQRALAVIN